MRIDGQGAGRIGVVERASVAGVRGRCTVTAGRVRVAEWGAAAALTGNCDESFHDGKSKSITSATNWPDDLCGSIYAATASASLWIVHAVAA